ncbi:mannose-6-phosphate isomerase [Xylona heveae TC161]|uniref:Mannose-6-phosphate isomerase n=1 Tax=Xylona heveae (strain CBS 132557 / TC161) TaxID=1328760 RepID=A0A164ZWL6_XYLHT|nr:mannose-6-phosphate isomerase [Xylona heveae TC161]KZF19625.1 mannose-6-phosphate isomerase [Xylona heveae TC161]
MQVSLIRLQCGVNSYDWGKVGQESAAARFASATPSDDFSIESEKPYAELWMGTHTSLPSRDLETKRTLLDLVQDNQALMSQDISKRFGPKLPFLFKVLSIRKALSIQAHPNKSLAEQLHKQDPKNYPDDNHKPEMTIAITKFDGLCGFRPLAEISHFLATVPPLRRLVGESNAKQFEATIQGRETSESESDKAENKQALREAFAALLKSDQDSIESAAKELISSAEKDGNNFAGDGGPSNDGQELADLVIRLNGQFPGDIGLFVLFFLNYIKMAPGEAMFLKADDIHAYLSGDIIECMASSDNVIRAGFTPKFKDVDTLVSTLTYSYAPISEQKMHPVDYPYVTLSAAAYSSNSSSILYDPPIDEFSVVKTELNKANAKATFEPIAGPSIFICTGGEGKIRVGPKVEEVKPGYVFFVGATAECVLESTSEVPFTTFKAFCDLGGKEDADRGRL